MIVVCTTCQARFKVADEKIGPRGAKVRCSKCQTVFIVHRDLGVMPAEEAPAAPPAPRRPGPGELDLEAEPMGGTRPSGFIADPFSRTAAPAPSPAADPFDAQSQAPAPSPFGAAHDPFGGADPFGVQPPTAGGHEGFATSGASLGVVDPFVATVSGPSHGLPTSAVTDLSDLIGGAHGAALQAPAATPPPEPSGILETGFDFDPSAPAPELEVAQPPQPQQPPGMAAPEPDLALAERTPTTGVPVHGAPSIPMPGADGFGGLDPFSGPTSMGSSAPDFGGPDEEFGMGPDLVEPPPHPVPAPPPPPEPLELAAAAPEPPQGESPELAAPEQAAAGLRRRSSRLRAVVINAISLAALLIVAVALLAFWRGMRPGSGGLRLLRPATLFGSAGAQQAPFTAAQLRSGLYDRADAAPVLFVTGSAVSHAASAVPGLRVRVELVRQGAVVAQGEARAGAVPTPEELYGSRDAAGIAAVQDRLAARAPHDVKPGDAVPFLVAINDFPPDVAGVGLRVTVEPIAADGAKGEPGR